MNRLTQHTFEPEEVMAYLDGELEARQAGALASHLEHCAECQTVAAHLRQVSERLLDFEIEPCSATFDASTLSSTEQRKLSKVKQETVAGHRRTFTRLAHKLVPQSPLGWAGAFGTVAVLVIAAMVVLGGLERQKQPAAEMELARPQLSYIYQPPEARSSPKPSRRANKSAGGGGGGADSNGNFRGSGNQATSAFSVDGSVIRELGPEEHTPGELETDQAQGIKAPEIRGPMIVQVASITILAQNYEEASGRLQPLTAAHGGYVQDMTAESRTGTARSVSATLRVPATQLELFLADLRKLGHVEQETRNNQEVTDAYIDLNARLKTARATEQRILQLLGTRTGKLSDVLEAEQELERVRGEIESMDGQRAHMEHQVEYTTVQVQLNEAYREQLNPESFSTGRRLRNSLVEGLGNLAGGVTGLALFLFAYGPSIIFWVALFGVPSWFIWRRVKKTKSA